MGKHSAATESAEPVARPRVVDVHTHAFPDPLAPRAIAALESECPWKAVGGGTLAELLASMDAAGVDVSVVCSIATKPAQVDPILQWCKQIRSDRIEPLPSVHPDTPQADRAIAAIADAGFVGVKLHPMYQAFALDEPRMEPIYKSCQEAGLWITTHCGLDIAYPPDDDRAAPQRLRRVMDMFPDLPIVATHMGGWQRWDASAELVIGSDCWIETSFSVKDLGPQRTLDLMERHGFDRVLMGSDWPWSSQLAELTQLASLGLDDDTLARIRGANAAVLLRQ